ncbi:unnamed protein product [Trichogramma brassicae]|uniref:Uncharacterized protein n=1 Tax=Trichogramma brassicae TaxID=86971 RepID=A0A6H5I1B8_9HYME|nr:unnamed protein product [Trichogramma brassicae]
MKTSCFNCQGGRVEGARLTISRSNAPDAIDYRTSEKNVRKGKSSRHQPDHEVRVHYQYTNPTILGVLEKQVLFRRPHCIELQRNDPSADMRELSQRLFVDAWLVVSATSGANFAKTLDDLFTRILSDENGEH